MDKEVKEISNNILDDFESELTQIIKDGKSDEDLLNKFNTALEAGYPEQVYANMLIWCAFMKPLPIILKMKQILKTKYYDTIN